MSRVRALCAVALVLTLSPAAFGRKPEDVLGGRIMMSEKPYPQSARSPQAFTGQVKKQSRERFQEDPDKHLWKIHYAAFFKQPLDDLELQVRFFDVTSGRRMVEAFDQYLLQRGQRVVTGSFTLKRGNGDGTGYDPNTKIVVIMESQGQKVATGTVFLMGEPRKYKGKVEFSEEETDEPEPGKDAPEQK